MKKVDKKKYTKPVVKKNSPLVSITFASAIPGGSSALPGTGGSPGSAIG